MTTTEAIHANRIADLLGEPIADAVVTIRVPRPTTPFDGAILSYYGEKTTARPDLESAARDWIESGMWSALEAYAMHASDYSRGVLRTTYNPTTRTWGEWK